MPDLPENQADSSHAFDPLVQTENIAFKPDELNACAACGRMNAPTRLKCLYCAAALEVKTEFAASMKPVLRKLESWERGFNVIVHEHSGQTEIAKVAAYLSAEPDDVRALLDAGSPLPLARVESEAETKVLIEGLNNFGLRCAVVGDAELDADKLPVRLSGIEFGENGIVVVDFNTRDTTSISDLALIIPGIITSSKVDSLEKKLRGGKTKLLEETASASDESVLDIYSGRDPVGFRVQLAGFDFSCLGEDKGLLAVENMRRLVTALKEHAPNARLVSDYAKVRHALGRIWEVEARKDTQGLQRAGFGKVEFGSVASTSNLRQFTKYSRLQWQILKG